jgi:hypothetical protein
METKNVISSLNDYGGQKKIPFNIEGLNETTGFGIENAIN